MEMERYRQVAELGARRYAGSLRGGRLTAPRQVGDTRQPMGPDARTSRATTTSQSQRGAGTPPPRVPARSPREGLLALQRRAGNRAVAQVLSRRVVGTDAATRVVRLEVGLELTEKLARAGYTLTAKGPLDEAGVEQLRQVALEHYFGTIDDDERLFIAALLDAGNAAKLHDQYPHGFSDNGSVMEFTAASIPESHRRIVRDSGRNVRIEPDARVKAFIKDPLDQDIVAMAGDFGIVAMQTLKLADKAAISHLKVYFAMLNGASDSTPGDRAYAGAAYVVAASEGMTDIAHEIMAQNLKIDEVSQAWFDAEGEGTHAEFMPESDGQRKGELEDHANSGSTGSGSASAAIISRSSCRAATCAMPISPKSRLSIIVSPLGNNSR